MVQRANQSSPAAPETKNAALHPKWITSQGTIKGVRIAPTLLPALKIPVARARSFRGNHSVTVLMLAGNAADSPRPKAARANVKLKIEVQAACAMAATLQKTIERPYPMRVPTLSIKRP